MASTTILQGAASAIALFVLGAQPAAIAQTNSCTPQEPQKARPQGVVNLADFVDGVMAQQIASREVAGAVVMAVSRGGTLFARGYGFSNIEGGVEVDAQRTLFRLGSTSKLFTWTALMQQVELGRVALDEDVNRYIDFTIPPFDGRTILVRHLMSHSPGMSDVDGFWVEKIEELSPYSEWIKAHIPERLWASGTEVAYSNYGVALAGYIVERVSGEPFAQYVENHIFAPLDMDSTTFKEPLSKSLSPRMAKGYELENGRLVAQPFELASSIMPAGSATSTAVDMARFMMMMLNDGQLGRVRILKRQSACLLMSDSLANAPGLPGMAHGFYVVRNDGPRIVGHAGNTFDFHTNLILAPESEFGFFVSMTGGDNSSLGRTELSNAVIGRVFPQEPAPRVAAPKGSIPPVGSYRTNRRDFARDPRPEFDVKVAAAGASAIIVTNRNTVSYWERIGPMTYELATGARAGGPYDRVRFYGEAEDLRMSFASQPYLTYRRITP